MFIVSDLNGSNGSVAVYFQKVATSNRNHYCKQPPSKCNKLILCRFLARYSFNTSKFTFKSFMLRAVCRRIVCVCVGESVDNGWANGINFVSPIWLIK